MLSHMLDNSLQKRHWSSGYSGKPPDTNIAININDHDTIKSDLWMSLGHNPESLRTTLSYYDFPTCMSGTLQPLWLSFLLLNPTNTFPLYSLPPALWGTGSCPSFFQVSTQWPFFLKYLKLFHITLIISTIPGITPLTVLGWRELPHSSLFPFPR